jgi:hypothetical protein
VLCRLSRREEVDPDEPGRDRELEVMPARPIPEPIPIPEPMPTSPVPGTKFLPIPPGMWLLRVPPGICDILRPAKSSEYSGGEAKVDLSIGFGANRAGFDMNGATLFRVSGRAGLAFLSMRMRGGVDLVEAAIELAVDGREE